MTTATTPELAIEPKPRDFLRSAVHHNSIFSRAGMSERLFTWWFGGFVYNQIWEDPAVDAQALEFNPESRLITIASGGCNVLNYLQHKPERVVAIDLNRHHIYLTRLKLAALAFLPDHESFYSFFGVGKDKANVAAYHDLIRDHLDAGARQYWDKRIKYFSRGFYNHSKLGMLLRFSHFVGRRINIDASKILDCQTQQEQRAFFDKTLEPYFKNKMVRAIAKLPFVGFSLGIPPRQHAEMMDDCDHQIADLYRERALKLLCDFPIQDNYFAWQAVARKYDSENRHGLPDYLKADRFDTMRGQLDTVETHVASYTEFLETQPDDSLDRFILLDSQDWMTPTQLTSLWTQIERVGRPGTRIIYRTASSRSPVEKSIPEELLARFTPERDRADELFKQDRAAIYGGFHIYVKKD